MSTLSSASTSNDEMHEVPEDFPNQVECCPEYPTIQSKPPGFKGYLRKRRGIYALADETPEKCSIEPPIDLSQRMKKFFTAQEIEWYNLRRQHITKKEELIRVARQEILEYRELAALLLDNESVPHSGRTGVEDRLQHVIDKWKKVKDEILKRHDCQACDLYLYQKSYWRWEMMDDIGMDLRKKLTIKEDDTPRTDVSDDFDVIPA